MQGNRVITQIGSLPYEHIADAVAYSLRHDIPFLPELPKLGDSMLDYIKSPGELSCLKEFKKHSFDIVKIQCIGPATLISSGYDSDEAVSRAYNRISAILDGLRAEEIILFLDEPALGSVSFDYKSLWAALFKSFDVIPGVHTCGNMDWDRLFDSDLEIISFDASKYNPTTYPKYRNGKRIASGIQSPKDIRDFQTGDLLTLPCGMGSPEYQITDCERNLEMLLRAKAQVLS